jgi:hypothetical protein
VKNARITHPSQLGDKHLEIVDFHTRGAVKVFEREDWTLFRSLGTLGQKAGVSLEKLPALIVKELVDNALDVSGGARAGLLVDNGFFVQDVGPGISGTDDEVAALFSIRRPLTSSKLLRLPTRGAMGNGLRVVTGAVLASGGTMSVETRGRRLMLTPRDDGGTTPEVIGTASDVGTTIRVHLGRNLVVNQKAMAWGRVAIALSDGSCYAGKTSPHWYDSDSFHELLRAAVGQSVVEVIKQFDGCAHPISGKIAGEFAGRKAVDLDRAEADHLLDRARKIARSVNPDRLGCVGPAVEGFPSFYGKRIGWFRSAMGRGLFDAALPCVIEAWAEIAKSESVCVSVNRTPVMADVACHHDKKEGSLDIFGCGLSHGFNIGRRPVRLHLNIDTPYMPITNDGKSPDLLPLLEPITEVISKAARKAKAKTPARVMGEVRTQKSIILGCLDAAIAKASDNGNYRFSLRQLFYAVRPFMLDSLGKEPDYGYFGRVIGEYEDELGRDVPGIFRDARGTLYHPHNRETIALGTRNVEEYKRPAWTFNKVLYSEKEGFFEIMRSVNWPERHDCALLTSKGFASRAARDVIDLLGETDEELTFYCIHDADAYGTTIYQALQDATKARPARKVQIVNLGLEPDEAVKMELQIEPVERKGEGSAAVAGYVSPEWAEWLQTKRVELNAMTTPRFLEWLDGKFEGRDDKVVPPVKVAVEHLSRGVHVHLYGIISAEVLREARVPELVDAEYEKRRPLIDTYATTLRDDVRKSLDDEREKPWTEPVEALAVEIAER